MNNVLKFIVSLEVIVEPINLITRLLRRSRSKFSLRLERCYQNNWNLYLSGSTYVYCLKVGTCYEYYFLSADTEEGL